MVFGKLFEPFIAGSPVSVMFRGTLENVLAAERLDRIFENAAQKQTCRDLAFSTCADLLGMVVTRVRRSLNAAYLAHRQAVTVSIQSVYNKLARIEPAVSEALVRETARDLAEIQAKCMPRGRTASRSRRTDCRRQSFGGNPTSAERTAAVGRRRSAGPHPGGTQSTAAIDRGCGRLRGRPCQPEALVCEAAGKSPAAAVLDRR